MPVPEINDATFQKEVLESDVPVLVEFYAPWCQLSSVLQESMENLSVETMPHGTKPVRLNIHEHMKTPMDYEVYAIPCVILFKGGRPVAKQVGAGGGSQTLHRLVKSYGGSVAG